MTRWLAAAAALVLLAACAPVRIKGDAGMLATQTAREQALAGRDSWTLEARLAVSDGEHGGSGSLTWKQDGDTYVFTVRAPVTGRSFRLSGGPGGAVLEGLDRGTVRGPNAEILLARTLGWQVPLAPLRDWVRGLRAEGATSSTAKLRFGEGGLPSLLVQDGWSIEYRDWFTDTDPPLPRKVYAAHGPYHVRLSIRRWSVGGS